MMVLGWGLLALWAALKSGPVRPEAPIIEQQPLEQPTFALIHTNDTRGYLESCGCGGDNGGGLARRAALIKSLRELYKNVILVDSGNLANRTDTLDVMARAMVRMGYDAVGIGVWEAGLGEEVETIAQKTGLPLIGATGPRDGEASPGRTVVAVSGLRVGIVATAWVPDPENAEYRAKLQNLLQAARQGSDFVVLLSQLGHEEDRLLLASEGFGDLVDVVVGTATVSLNEEAYFMGRTLILPGFKQGRKVGVLEVKLADARIHYHHEVITLAADLPEDPEIAKVVDEYYVTRERELGSVKIAPPVGYPDQPPLPDVFTVQEARNIRARGYLTAPDCSKCHTEEFEQWQTTAHARALQTLIDRGRAVTECLTCHSEAARRGMPYDPEGLDRHGVDCAACHGAGLFHASTNGGKDTIVRTPTEITCRRCHNDERDVNFALELRLPPVTH
ncbi:MAG: multiheme c-type cytochrome [Candidatus Zipacnadales bacterium]